MDELKKRSALKSFIWRIIGIIILSIVTYFYTRKLIQTSIIVVLHHGIFLIVFYLHERMWMKINVKNITKRSILKCITYETLLGNIILGTITYLVTGKGKQMTNITLTYIGIKHAIFIWNEFVWRKIKWGTK